MVLNTVLQDCRRDPEKLRAPTAVIQMMALGQRVRFRTTFTRTSHDQATTVEQRQEPEEDQSSAQVRAKKPRTRVTTTAAEYKDQER